MLGGAAGVPSVSLRSTGVNVHGMTRVYLGRICGVAASQNIIFIIAVIFGDF